MIYPNFHTKINSLSKNRGEFIIEPLASSFGNSLGNALRRTLLSSLKGMALTAIKIEGVPHLFSTIKGVKESVLEIVLNLKQLRFEVAEEGRHKISLTKKGNGKVFGKDIEGDIKVINDDVYIGEITDSKVKLQIEAIAELGFGYIPADEQDNMEFGFFPVDSSFSPVKRVNFKIEEARVGRKTNFDRLILDIETDGSITPDEALKQAATILGSHFSRILSVEDTQPQEKKLDETKTIEQIDRKFTDLIIDELSLPSRVVNALLRENIETVADLMKIGKNKLIVLKGLGKKSIDLIEVELKKLGVELK